MLYHDLANALEGAFNHMLQLDNVPFHIKRQIAEQTAKLAFDLLEGRFSGDEPPKSYLVFFD